MNDFMHHTRVTGLDGTELDERKGEGRLVALPPGKHWVQISRIDHSMRQWRDFNVTYGFELDAVADTCTASVSSPPPASLQAVSMQHSMPT